MALGPSWRHKTRWLHRLVSRYGLGGRILNVACGEGSLLASLDTPQNELHGVDRSMPALLLARRRCPRASFVRGDITENTTGLRPGSFDVVICANALEEMGNDEAALRNMAALLRPGGHLLLVVPHGQHYWSVHDEYARNLRRYEADRLTEQASAAGLLIRLCMPWGYPFYTAYYRLALTRSGGHGELYTPRSGLKRAAASCLFWLLQLDDLWRGTQRGRILFLVAQRPEDTP